MSKDPRVYLAHILECAQKIERFTADGRQRFSQDVMVQDAGPVGQIAMHQRKKRRGRCPVKAN
jgi:hypothetical protein